MKFPLIKKLAKLLKKHKKQQIFIQTHNFPDHDAVASAFALQYILSLFKIQSHIVYHGEILRDSLLKMITELGIDIHHHYHYNINPDDNIIIVDGCIGHKNVAELNGKVIAVIDHHIAESPDFVKYVDIRSDYGACATLIFSYFAQLKHELPKNIATALLTAINFDTVQLTRDINYIDIETYALLYRIADTKLVNSLVRNSIKLEDLPEFSYIIKHMIIHDKFAFCFIPHGCNKNLLAILSDFTLGLDEIEFVAFCTQNTDAVNFSIRSECSQAPANAAITEVLEEIGSGGGHKDMAGGRINDFSLFDEKKIYDRFVIHLKKTPVIT